VTARITPIAVPPSSDIAQYLPGADFFDAYEMPLEHRGRPALDIYLQVIARTPAWVNFLMTVRNRIVAFVGLKNLGHLDDVIPNKDAAAYPVGSRVGIFSLLSATDDEIVLGDSDKHLDVRVSIRKLKRETRETVAVSTVVHIHNRLGRAYMFVVAPVHRLIVPAVLARAGA